MSNRSQQDDGPLSCGVVITRDINDERHFLLLRAYQYWDFPKGMAERGETPMEAALREVEEETGLTQLLFHWGHYYYETPPYGRVRKVAHYYVAEAPEGEVYLPINEELGRPEHEEFCWVNLAEAKSLVSPRVSMVLDWAEHVIEHG